ncbi:MAG: hypothetical protein M1540_09275 [Candidatus Bathyarchaeota archaeon]|nr:hypothetical protein [Candidatus Bathyarchaeota archaeon]
MPVTTQNDKVLDVLVRLGLTELQAKTYLTIARLEKAEVKTISKLSNIARQDIYRIMPTLEKLGLVEEIIATPKLYKAIPLNEGTTKLFQKRTEEHTKLKSSIKQLTEKPEKNPEAEIQSSESEFVITYERKRLITKLERSYSEASKCEVMLPGNAINFMIHNFYECISLALSRGTKIRVISKKTDMSSVTARKFANLKANPNFKIKFADSEFDFGLVIYDDKELNIAISDKELPSLQTNNPQIIKLGQMTFENEWNAGQSV